jgi:hypothetical protein
MIAVCARAVCIGNGLGRIKLTALPTSKAQRPLAVLGFKREPMIKDVMVWLDGSLADEVRLEVAAGIARHFESQVVALVFNPMPLPGPIEGGSGAAVNAELLEKARGAGDKTEAKLVKRLKLLDRPVEIQRFDVLANDIANNAAREARAADTFVALRPNGAMDPERLVEGVLFGSVPVSGSRAAENRVRSLPDRMERQPRVSSVHGRRHAISAQGEGRYGRGHA